MYEAKLTLTHSGGHGNPIVQRLDIVGKGVLQSVQAGLQRADPVVVCPQLGPQRLDHRGLLQHQRLQRGHADVIRPLLSRARVYFRSFWRDGCRQRHQYRQERCALHRVV